MSAFIDEGLQNAQQLLNSFLSLPENISKIEKIVRLMSSSYRNGKKILSCGNGGSLCDAMHFAEELTGRFRKERPPLAAMALTDPAHLTCVANDYGYQYVFSRAVQAFGDKGDILLAISTSGRSLSIVEAVKTAQAKGMNTVGLLGKGGGKLKDLVDISLIIESTVTDRIQEMHIKIIHLFIEGVERDLFPENYSRP